MHVVHFCPSSSFSGLEQYAFDLALDQTRKGIRVSFVVAPGSRLESECEAQGITTIPVSHVNSKGRPNLFGIWKLNEAIDNEIKDSAQVIFHLHTTHEIYNALLPKFSNKRIKVIMQFHLWIDRNKRDLFHRLLYRFVDEIWCSSQAAKKVLEKALPVPSQKISVIRYGRPVEEEQKSWLSRDEARLELGIPKNHIAYLTMSALHPMKGQKELLLATDRLSQQMANDVNSDFDQMLVHCIGGARPNEQDAEIYEKELKEVLKNKPQLAKHFKLLGGKERAFRYLKAYDVFVLPSYLECFSLGLLDAQLAGLPVVGTNAGGTPDVVVENETGWLSEPENVESLSLALKKSLNDRSKWSSMGEKASRRVENEFSQKTIFAAIIENYRQLLAKGD